MRRSALLSAVALAPLLPLAAAAQEASLSPVVISAGREPVAADRTGATVSVIERAGIEAAGDSRLIDILARTAGFATSTRGPIGTNTGFTLRGASQNHVLVLIDGINVADPSGPQVAYDFGTLTTLDTGRVEVLKGSQSALYGANAVGGVVSISSARATQDGVHHSVAIEAGSHDTLRLAYGFAARGDRHDIAFTLSHLRTDGFSAADERAGNTEADGFEGSRLSFSGGYEFENGLRLSAAGFYEDSHGNYDASDWMTGLPVDEVPPGANTTDIHSRGLRVAADFATGRVDHTLTFTYFDIDRVSNSAYGPSIYAGTRTGVSYQGGVDLGAALRLVFGADTSKEESSDNWGFDASSRVNGAFAELNWAVTPDLDLSLTLRGDDHSRFGGQTTGRLAAAWRVAPDVVLRGSAGTGFRAPSNYELFSAYGDPDLGPEESRSYDLGIEKRWGAAAFARVTLFHIDAEDMIFFDNSGADCESAASTGWLGCYAQASGHTRRTGLEIEARAPLGERFAATAAYTYMDSATNATSAWIRPPRHVLALSLAAEVTERVTALATVEHGSGRQDLSDYTVAHATVTYDVGPDTQAYLRVENVFDEHYQLVRGYGTSDRAVHVGLRKAF